MNLFQQIRNKAFWTKDFFNQSPIRNHIRDIKAILEDFSSNQSRQKRAQILDDLLTHATRTTPFYHELKHLRDLQDFPVVNKNIIRDNYAAFRSSSYLGQPTIPIMTSGSTGTPFTAHQDRNKKARNTADTIYFAGKAHFHIGQQLIYMRRWSHDVRKSKLLALIQNIRMVNVTELNDAYFEKWLKELQNDRQEKCLMGYVSAMTELCKYLDKVNSPPLHCGVTSIIAVAEALNEYCRSSMEKYFGVPVVSRYSNMENGILAQEFPGYRHFNINWASYVIEILDEETDDPAPYGTLGRIVITDLFNYAMPMIRYDTGDVGIMNLDSEGVPVLTEVHGRRLDMLYNTRGEVVSPAVVWELKYFPNIQQFQLIQNDRKSYTIRLTLDGPFDSHAEVIRKYKTHLGEDAEISLEMTDEIPVLKSGKRKLVVNNYSMES